MSFLLLLIQLLGLKDSLLVATTAENLHMASSRSLSVTVKKPLQQIMCPGSATPGRSFSFSFSSVSCFDFLCQHYLELTGEWAIRALVFCIFAVDFKVLVAFSSCCGFVSSEAEAMYGLETFLDTHSWTSTILEGLK